MKRAKPSNKSRRQQEIILLGLGAVAVLIVVVGAFIYRFQSSAAVDLALLVREDSPSIGPIDAPVTLVAFLDPECEACRAAHPVVEQILEDYAGQIRYVVRYVPNHSNSALAVAATEGAGEQGLYWEMQALLFTRQPEWGERQIPQTELFMTYAQELGLNMDQFAAALQNSAYFEKAERDGQDATAVGVRGTPTFFVNGEVVYGMNEGILRSLIEAGL